MSNQANTSEEYIALLAEHTAVKELDGKKVVSPPKAKTRSRGIPKLLSDQLTNENVKTMVGATRRMMKYHRSVNELSKQRLKGQKIPLNDEIAFVRKGAKAETDFRQMISSGSAAARSNPATEAYAAAIATRPNDMHVFANPAFLSRSELAVVKYLGIEPKELTNYFEYFFLPRRQKVLEGLASGAINDLLEITETIAPRIPFPEAPRYLVARNLLTFGGDDDAVDYVAGTVAIVVGVATTAVGVPWLGVPLIVGGAISIAKEAAEDLGILEEDKESSVEFTYPLPASNYQSWVSETQNQTAGERINSFGYALGNMSRTKLELHMPSCPFLHLIHPRHLRRFNNIDEGRAAGLDNCHYCIGGSLR